MYIMNLGVEISMSFLIFFTWLCGVESVLYLQPKVPNKGHFVGDGFFVTCTISGDGSANDLSWINPSDERIASRNDRIRVQSTSDKKGLELVVEKVQFGDDGKYTCRGPEASESFVLSVYRPINFGDTQKHQHSLEGKNALITCHVTSSPDLVIFWDYKGASIKDDDKHVITTSGVEIINVTREDAGIYSCKASVTTPYDFQQKKFDINFEVYYPPEFIIEEEAAVYTQIGAVANLSCTVSAVPPAKFHWTRNGSPIFNSSDFVIFHYENRSILQFTVTDDSLLGIYVCTANNQEGTELKEITVKEGNSPGVAQLKIAKEVEDTLLLELNAPDSEDLKVIAFKVELALATETWDQARFQEFKKGDEYILTNMSYNTEYQLRASAKNLAGYGDYSETVEHKTKPLQVSPVTSGKDSTTSFILMVICSCIMGFLLA